MLFGTFQHPQSTASPPSLRLRLIGTEDEKKDKEKENWTTINPYLSKSLTCKVLASAQRLTRYSPDYTGICCFDPARMCSIACRPDAHVGDVLLSLLDQ